MKTISIHSSRGGTGKSLIAVNLAAIYALRGRNVALLDLDFRAPSFSTIFGLGVYKRINFWLNDFLDGKCSAEEALIDFSDRYGTKGKLLVGFANPGVDAMREMAAKNRKWQMEALRRLLNLKTSLRNLGVDYVLLDTTPGINYHSVNAVVSSDISIVVITMDVLDIEGARRMISELYDAFEKRTVILANKVAPYHYMSKGEEEVFKRRLQVLFKYPLIAVVPCFCDVLQTSRVIILTLESPDHPFVRILDEVATKLEEL